MPGGVFLPDPVSPGRDPSPGALPAPGRRRPCHTAAISGNGGGGRRGSRPAQPCAPEQGVHAARCRTPGNFGGWEGKPCLPAWVSGFPAPREAEPPPSPTARREVVGKRGAQTGGGGGKHRRTPSHTAPHFVGAACEAGSASRRRAHPLASHTARHKAASGDATPFPPNTPSPIPPLPAQPARLPCGAARDAQRGRGGRSLRVLLDTGMGGEAALTLFQIYMCDTLTGEKQVGT